jgi:DNA polymerase
MELPYFADEELIMLRQSETGPTFAIDEIGFLDFESRSTTLDLARVGSYRYAVEADAVIAAYAIGNGPVHVIAVPDFPDGLCWADMPKEFQDHHRRVQCGEAIWMAWNAGFDRAIWNYATDFPKLEHYHIIDAMAQAVASGLGAGLDIAAKQSNSSHKVEAGKELIKLFCVPEDKVSSSSKMRKNTKTKPKGTGTPVKDPVEWAQFCQYAGNDIIAMRSVFAHTRQLPWREWHQYWASEHVNERGAAIDLKMVAHAAKLAEEDKYRSKKEVQKLTNGVLQTIDQVQGITQWLLARLPVQGREILIKRVEEIDEETGAVTRPAKHSLTRKRVEKLIALLQAQKYPDQFTAAMLRLLQIRLYGGSKTPAKFKRVLEQHVDGVLFGQYVFNGAAHTGRYSSKGVQCHNLARDALNNEPDLIDALLQECKYDTLAELGTNDPVARKLALLIRPTFVPSSSSNIFVWSDWSQIEARVLPWLAGDDARALARLKIFSDVDADPSLPDLYTRTASDISGVPIEAVTSAIRQRGKVAELALGFGGGVNALQNMAANYGMHIDIDEAKDIVSRWRAANQWAADFSASLWGAMHEAHNFPTNYVPAGRVGFVFIRNYLGGSMMMRLPSGRILTYRALRWEQLDVLDDDGEPTGEKTTELTYARGYGRVKLWAGVLVENATQACAADFLRETLVRLVEHNFDVRLHVHDEILVECKIEDAKKTKARLRAIMLQGFDWSKGLPLMSEETIAWSYTKHEKSKLMDVDLAMACV